MNRSHGEHCRLFVFVVHLMEVLFQMEKKREDEWMSGNELKIIQTL